MIAPTKTAAAATAFGLTVHALLSVSGTLADPAEGTASAFLGCPTSGESARYSVRRTWSGDAEEMATAAATTTTTSSQQEELPDAPSPAPSMAFPCGSQYSNARGVYSTSAAPCKFTFHNAGDVGGESPEYSMFHTSALCDESNAFESVKEYVVDWGDECVGDFARCYSVEYHRSVLFDFVCKEWDGDVPEGTTHISVDCREDKALVVDAAAKEKEEEARIHKGEKIERVESKLFNVALYMGCFVAAVHFVSKWIIGPLVSARLHGPPPPAGCSSFRTGECRCCGDGVGGASTVRDGSLRGQEEDEGGDFGSGASEYSDESFGDDGLFDMQIPADFDAVPIVRRSSSYRQSSSGSLPSRGAIAAGGADASDPPSVPPTSTVDYDGVPIAAATVIPDYT